MICNNLFWRQVYPGTQLHW